MLVPKQAKREKAKIFIKKVTDSTFFALTFGQNLNMDQRNSFDKEN